jgi:hypothetical protein
MDELRTLIQHPITLYVLALGGMLMHFLKEQKMGQHVVDIKNYFSDHFKDTFVAWTATTFGYIVFVMTLAPVTAQAGTAGAVIDVGSVIACGYMCDSFFNKWTKTQEQKP